MKIFLSKASQNEYEAVSARAEDFWLPGDQEAMRFFESFQPPTHPLGEYAVRLHAHCVNHDGVTRDGVSRLRLTGLIYVVILGGDGDQVQPKELAYHDHGAGRARLIRCFEPIHTSWDWLMDYAPDKKPQETRLKSNAGDILRQRILAQVQDQARELEAGAASLRRLAGEMDRLRATALAAAQG